MSRVSHDTRRTRWTTGRGSSVESGGHPEASLQRFAVVVPSLASGGAERVAIHLAHGLRAAGREVELVALDGRGPLRTAIEPDLPVRDLGRPRARAAAVPLLRHLRRRAPDVVLATQTHLNLLLASLTPLLGGVGLVLREPTLRGRRPDGRPRPVQRAMRIAYRRADLVLASSPAMVAELRDVLGPTGPRVLELPNPIDVSAVRSTPHGTPDRPTGGRHFVVVGRLVATKAVDDLIDAFAATSGPRDVLTVVGDGPERSALERRVETLALTGRVVLAGHVAAPWDLIAAADALVLPSRLEGMPNVALEALAAGTPVLATTDLEALTGLAAEAPEGAVHLVGRPDLADALRAIAPDPSPRPRPSLLPGRYARDAVVAGLLEALAGSGG